MKRDISRAAIARLHSPTFTGLGMKRAGRKFVLSDGTVIKVTKNFGVYQAHIHVPLYGEEPSEFAGYIVYPYTGWMYMARNYRTLFFPEGEGSTDAYFYPMLMPHTPRWWHHREVSWKPPYYVDGDTDFPYEEDGVNRGTVKEEDPSYPRWLIPSPEVENTEPDADVVRWREKLIKKENADFLYDPTRDTEDWYAKFGAAVDPPDSSINTWAGDERYYKNYAHWKTADSKYHLHWQGNMNGHVGIDADKKGTDFCNRIYVNGREYNPPGPCIGGCVHQDQNNGKDWLIVWVAADFFEQQTAGGAYSVVYPSMWICQLKNGKLPHPYRVWCVDTFAELEDEKKIEYQYDWFHYTDDGVDLNIDEVQGIAWGAGVAPLDQSTYTWYEQYETVPGALAGDANERYIYDGPQDIYVNSTATKFLMTWLADGLSGTQVNEYFMNPYFATHEIGDDIIYAPWISILSSYSNKTTFTLDNFTYGASWYQSGTVPLKAIYDENDTIIYFNMQLEFWCERVNHGTVEEPDYHYPVQKARSTFTFDGNTWVLLTERTSTYGVGITSLTASGEYPAYYDYFTKDKIIEKMPTCSMSSQDPAIMSWTYSREVYLEGSLVSTDSGSATFNATFPAYYGDRPFLNFGQYHDGSPGTGAWTSAHANEWLESAYPAPLHIRMEAGYDNESTRGGNTKGPSNEPRPDFLWFAKVCRQPGFAMHPHPGGYRIGMYVEKSFQGVDDWYDYVATTSTTTGPEYNFRVRPSYFISGDTHEDGRTLLQILQLNDNVDTLGKTVVPIVDVMYYRRSNQRKVRPWRTT